MRDSTTEDNSRRSFSPSAIDDMSEPLVEILMSTHNGAKYLEAQLDSLFAQTYRNWRLIVRDDMSSDQSVDILGRYSRRHPGKLVLVTDTRGQLGACQSFAMVMKHATADYMMFCDQDDVWLPQKVELSLKHLLSFEKSNPGIPLLMFTDLTVVDDKLTPLCDSFWRYQRINPRNTTPNSLVFENVVTGCTMLFNKRLKDISEPIPLEALMHDWWLALVCSIHGRLIHVEEKTLLYRQHGKNDLGAQDYSLGFRVSKFVKSPKAFMKRTTSMASLMRLQAEALLKHLQAHPTGDLRRALPLQDYVGSRGLMQRKWCLVKHWMLSGNYIRGVRKFLFY